MPRITLAALSALLLLSCGSAPPVSSADEPAASRRAIAIAQPRFHDHDPHAWDEDAPWAYPVHGIDVSRWQPAIDWPVARAAGISFAFIKATEGVEELDPMFRTHWDGAGRAGVPRGAYHYFYFCAPADKQARWFIANVPRTADGLPHVLDMEWNPHSPTCRHRPDAATVRAEAKTFLDIVEGHFGRRPIIYTTLDFARDTGIEQLPRTRFWLRSVAGHPRDTFPGVRWDFWQYTGTGNVAGIPGPVDINVFHGSVAAWQSRGGSAS